MHVDTTPAGLPYGLLIEEFLPGRPLDYLDPADLSRAAQTLARLHAFRLPEADATLLRIERPLSMYLQFGREMLAPYRAAPNASGEVLRILDAVERTLSAQAHLEDSHFPSSERGVVHTDVQAHNFIVQAAETRLVDWEKPMLDDPTYDLCHFLAPTTTRWKCGVTLSEPAQESFMEAYLSAREQDDGGPRSAGSGTLTRRLERRPLRAAPYPPAVRPLASHHLVHHGLGGVPAPRPSPAPRGHLGADHGVSAAGVPGGAVRAGAERAPLVELSAPQR